MLLVILVIFSVMKGHAQEDSSPSDFLVRVWQSEEGLPGNVVRSLGQASDGFLWVATAEGIARFDGIEFRTVAQPSEYQGPRMGYFRLFTLSEGEVWVSTFRGGLLKIEDFQLKRVIEDQVEPNSPLVTQVIQHQKDVIIKRGEKVFRYQSGKLESVEQPTEVILERLKLNRATMRNEGRADPGEGSPRIIDRSGGTWTSDRRGSIYYQKNGGSRRRMDFPELEERIFINEFLEDHEGNIWLASAVRGLVRIRHNRVIRLNTSEGTYTRPLNTAIQTHDGTWWMANRSGGVDRITATAHEHLELIPTGYSRPIVCIFEDSKKRLWFASRDGSVFEWTGERFELRFLETQIPSKVKVISEDSLGRIWFGGSQGFSLLKNGEINSFPNHPIASDVDITTLAPRPDGSMIAGTTDGRLIIAKDDEFHFLPSSPELHGRWISSILVLPHDEIWVGTLGSGLLLWKDGRWQQFGSAEGIPDERITAVTIHGDDQLWLGSLAGILSVSRTELIIHLSNKMLVPRWLRLDRSDGLMTRECIGGSQPPVWDSHDGTIWFPTGNGPAGVRPDDLEIRRSPPMIHLETVRVGGKPYPISDTPLVAGPGRSQLDFTFTGLNLSAPEKVTYNVQLHGWDERPRSIGTQRQISYQAVPPGKYRFEVSAVNGDGYATIIPAAAPIVINPHFWEATWFITLTTVLALLLALAIGWLIARIRLKNRIKILRLHSALEAERSRISRDLHDDLGASLTELSILSELAAENPNSDSLRDCCKTLASKAKVVVSTLDEIVWAASPAEDTLRSLIDYLGAFTREFLENAQVSFRIDVARDVPDVVIGPNRRHNLMLAAREATNNAVKHSKASEIKLVILVDEETLTVRIEDNGDGFNVEYAESGDGLSNLKRRMEDCGGGATIESSPRAGCTVTLMLPLVLTTSRTT